MLRRLAPSLHVSRQLSISRHDRLKRRSSVNDVLITVSNDVVVIVASGLFATSSLQLLNTVAHLKAPETAVVDSGDDDAAFVWSVATVMSLIPVFNFMAWSMAAQGSTDAASRFYTLSAVYAPAAIIPLVTGTPSLLSVLMYVLCILHVQVELTAAINPQAAAKVLAGLPGNGRQLISAGDRGARAMSAFMEALEYTVEKELKSSEPKLPLREQRLFEEDMQTQKELQQLETSEWDDKLQARSRRKGQ